MLLSTAGPILLIQLNNFLTIFFTIPAAENMFIFYLDRSAALFMHIEVDYRISGSINSVYHICPQLLIRTSETFY